MAWFSSMMSRALSGLAHTRKSWKVLARRRTCEGSSSRRSPVCPANQNSKRSLQCRVSTRDGFCYACRNEGRRRVGILTLVICSIPGLFCLPCLDASRADFKQNASTLNTWSCATKHPPLAVTDGSHKWCTRDDLIWWMELLSSSLPNATPAADDDLQFKRVARACWGIPANAPGVPGSQQDGAFGEAPQPVSVVVTHADGSITIERVSRQEVEVHPDGSGTLLISEAQAEKIRRQLSRRGVHAVHVHLLNEQKGTVHASPEAAGSSQETADVKHVGSILEGSFCSRPHGMRQLSADEVRTARLGPSGHGQGSRGADCFEEGEANLGFDHGMLR